eukprot:TRINITY_DN7861_c0_g1_i3.p1 TRINITY_DN7861_c0_g1~~TRINITY_DN7861_c0_g1_i3.p1  ORF type:complete len:223 (-),score=52.66 TRINITY_DN7861_c0_g1_i3:32-661(-)
MTLRGRVQLSLAVLLAEILAPCIGNGVGAAFTAAGLWVAVLEPQGYRETWSIATSGEVTIWSHSDRRAIVGELAGIKKEARLSAGFTHRIDFGEPGAYDLLSVQGGRMEIDDAADIDSHAYRDEACLAEAAESTATADVEAEDKSGQFVERSAEGERDVIVAAEDLEDAESSGVAAEETDACSCGEAAEAASDADEDSIWRLISRPKSF